MRRVFADTYYWIALLNDRDQGHAAARAISQTLPQPGIVTTQEVLSEVLTYFCAHGRQVRQTVAAFIRQILTDPAITVHPQSSQSFLSGLALYEARPDKEYSLTDCIITPNAPFA
jgi:predicted nucleic acid-binding protein